MANYQRVRQFAVDTHLSVSLVFTCKSLSILILTQKIAYKPFVYNELQAEDGTENPCVGGSRFLS